MFSCFYLFVAIAKVCQREQLSCLFQSVKESEQIHQALEIKKSTKCKIWHMCKKSHILMQDSNFVVEEHFNKEKVNKFVRLKRNIPLTLKD